MGRRLSALTLQSEDLRLVGGTEAAGSPAVGQDMGTLAGLGPTGVVAVGSLDGIIASGDVVVDFTTPESTLESAGIAAGNGKAMVVGTTGLSAEQTAQFKETVSRIACVYAPNYSVGVNLLFKLAKEAAQTLGPSFDVEITEAHHRFKKDAPSGTARRLAEAAAQGLSRDIEQVGVYGRKGMTGERTAEEIGIHAVRAGDIVGDHTVLFGGIGERIELTHRAQSRDTFAMGALRAIRFVAEAPVGLYDMQDVLGLR